jgi:arylsulfatase A-like enzyme
MNRRAFATAAVLSLAGIFWLVPGCAPHPPVETEHPVNVLLVVVDTLRADRLGCQGSDSGLTPALDEAAAGGVRFSNTSAHSPWTLPSMASLLTSRHPSGHRAGKKLGPFRFSTLPGEVPTLQERFAGAGYETAAVINVDFLSDAFGMTRGFDLVDFASSESNSGTRIAADTTDAALHRLRQLNGGPFFLLVHYFDPHLEYDPPAEFRRLHARPQDRAGAGHLFGSKVEMAALRQGRARLAPLMLERLEALYDGEVAYTDREVGRLLDRLAGLGLDSSTLVVITADHGEEFGDHQGFEHGHTLYQELLHVPLILRLPGRLPEARVVDSTVRLIDLAPTILELAGLPPQVEGFAGKSLVPLIEGREQGDRPVFAEGNFWGADLYSWHSDSFKLILRPGAGQGQPARTELFDLRQDPGERQNLAGQVPGRDDRLLADLQWVREQSGRGDHASSPGAVDLDPQQVRRLRLLGYLE